jgi:hypothetical protein
MKNFKHLCIFLIFLIGSNQFLLGQQDNSTTIKYLATWIVNDTIESPVVAIVSESDSAGCKIRKIAFYRESVDRQNLITVMNEMGNIVAMFPLKDASQNLMTIWTNGSAYEVVVFSFLDEKIYLTLDVGTRSYPELFYENSQTSELSIAISNCELNDKPDGTAWIPTTESIYTWSGKRYVKSNEITWDKRFLQKSH